ncbi:hypothetical protein ACWDAZ_37795 [Streptomyces sp. NPDC001215]
MTVVARSTYTTQDWDPPDPPNPPPAPPAPAGPPIYGVGPYVGVLRDQVAAVGLRFSTASTTTHYEITVRTADGRRRKFEVEHDFYLVAESGTVGTVEMWHGRLLRLRIGSHVDEQYPLRWTIPYVIMLVGVGFLGYPVFRLIRSMYEAVRWRRIARRLRRRPS